MKSQQRNYSHQQWRRRRILADWGVLFTVLKAGFSLAVVGWVVWGGWWLYQWAMLPTTLPVKHVQVAGELEYVDAVKLQKVLSKHVRGGFFSVDLPATQQQLETLPWVYEASLRRIWPDRVMVEIVEQQAIAQWGETGLLNKHGEIFYAPRNADTDYLPKIHGVIGREHELIKDYLLADKILQPLGLTLVELREDPRRDQRLQLRSGIVLALGRKNRQERLQRFAATFNETLAPFMERIRALDLRYANGYAVRWRQGADYVHSKHEEKV